MAAGEIMTTTATTGVATTSITVDTGTGTAGTTVGPGAGTTKHQPNENGGGVREQRPRRLAYHPLVGGQRGSTALADHRLDGRGVVLIAPICDFRWKRRNRQDRPPPPLALRFGD